MLASSRGQGARAAKTLSTQLGADIAARISMVLDIAGIFRRTQLGSDQLAITAFDEDVQLLRALRQTFKPADLVAAKQCFGGPQTPGCVQPIPSLPSQS